MYGIGLINPLEKMLAIILGLVVKFAGPFVLLGVLKPSEDHRIHAYESALAAWLTAYKEWEISYYCGRCDYIFIPQVIGS